MKKPSMEKLEKPSKEKAVKTNKINKSAVTWNIYEYLRIYRRYMKCNIND